MGYFYAAILTSFNTLLHIFYYDHCRAPYSKLLELHISIVSKNGGAMDNGAPLQKKVEYHFIVDYNQYMKGTMF